MAIQMKLDAAKIKRWREDRCWSQEHLAETAGVSLRTIQRLERGESVSRDTVMALAASFDVDAGALTVDVAEEAAKAAIAREREKNMQFMQSFWIHLATYVFVIGLLTAINLAARPEDIWVLWPAIGWGIGVAAHGMTAFFTSRTARHE